MVSLLACNQSAGPATPEECTGEACAAIYGASDQNPALQLEKTYTNAQDILVSWPENPAVSDWVLNIASDPNCLSIQKSITVAGATSTHLLDLDEGIWYLCLKSVSSPREIAVASSGQRLVVDRQGPKIEAEAAQTLASGDHVTVKVSDLTEAKCSWTTTDTALRITDSNDVLSPFSTAVGGTYSVTLSCQDQAENNSALAFTLTLSAGSVTTPGQPLNVKSLAATAATNAIALSWTDGGDGVSYLVLEASATITAGPADGMVYTVGSTIGTAKVKAVGTALTFNDTGLAGNSQHYYKVFAANAIGRYSAGVEVSATAVALKTLKATFSRTGSLTFNESIGHRTVGNFTYLCRGFDGLSVVNVSNPAQPSTGTPLGLGNNTSGWCSDVKIQGNYAYVADWERGLIVVDITNPAAPVQKGSLPLTNASVVYVEGNFAYVALEEDDGPGGGFAIVNITNPNSLTLVGNVVNTNGNAAGIAKVGNYLYLTHRNSGNNSGLRIYDITNPANVSSNPVKQFGRSSAEEIEVVGTFAYVTVGTSGLEIFDVTNPANPTSKGSSALPNNGFALSVRIVDTYAFVTANDASRLFVFDITNKTGNLSTIRNYTTLDRASWVDVVGGNAYVTSQRGGYEVVEVFQFQ